jgi:hypothetical protein
VSPLTVSLLDRRLTPVSRRSTSLPGGAKLKHWFCGE